MKKWMRRFINRVIGIDVQLLHNQVIDTKEILWALRWFSLIRNSKWLDGGVYPGGWAVGYPFLCILYRVLDECNPVSILELGLGQSTKLTASYMKKSRVDFGKKHYVVEHDGDWIKFMEKSIDLSYSTIVKLALCKKVYNHNEIYAYKDFKENICEEKYDLILIDGPFGSNVFSRMDVLNIIPEQLAEDFVIMFDDYNREGEKNTVEELLKILRSNNIKYCTGVYHGIKETMLICSKSRKFVCTMD